MSRKLLFLALATVAGGSGALAQQAAPFEAASGPGTVDKTTQTEDVRFRSDDLGHLTVPVRISGAGPFRFLVDTGANRTAVSRELAGRMKFVAGENAALHSLAGVSTVNTANVPSLQLTRKEVRNINAPLLEGENIGADGIIGTDSLRSQRVLFDFEAQTLSIVPSAVPDFRAEPGTIVVQGSRRNGRLVVTEATANGQSLTVVVDTGAQVSVGNSALRRKLLGARMLTDSHQVEMYSVTGEKIIGEYMFVRELDIGGVGLKNLAVVFADAHTFKQLKLDNRPALLLGMNAIRAFKKVSIDFASRKLRVIVPEESSLDLRLAARLN